MLLTLSTTHHPATGLGFLLRKNRARVRLRARGPRERAARPRRHTAAVVHHDFRAATRTPHAPPRLAAFERVLFECARPANIIFTTPNRDYNTLFPTLAAGTLRHRDHRFEWTRAEFAAWCETIHTRFGYSFQILPIGPEDATHGAPSQMGMF